MLTSAALVAAKTAIEGAPRSLVAEPICPSRLMIEPPFRMEIICLATPSRVSVGPLTLDANA